MSEPTPLSPAEVDALERYIENHCERTYKARAAINALLETVRDRERQLEQAVKMQAELDEVCDMLSPEWRGKFTLKELVQENIDSWSYQAQQLAEARKDTGRLLEASVGLLELIESNAPDGYYTENPRITQARKVIQQAIDAAREAK